MLFLVVVIAGAHGLWLLPAILSLVGGSKHSTELGAPDFSGVGIFRVFKTKRRDAAMVFFPGVAFVVGLEIIHKNPMVFAKMGVKKTCVFFTKKHM